MANIERELATISKLYEFDSYAALHALIDLLNPLEDTQHGVDRKGVAAILSVLLRAVDEDLRVAMEDG
jgi:hypothetical protein